MGFRRDGRMPGARNCLWIIPTSDLVCEDLRAMAEAYHKPYWIDGVEVFDDAWALSGAAFPDAAPVILHDLAANPNAAGVIFAGQAGDELYAWSLLDRIRAAGLGRGLHVRNISIDKAAADESAETFCVTLDRLAANAPRTRSLFDCSNLCVGVAAEGEPPDAAADSAIRDFSDWLVSNGGVILPAGRITDAPSAFASLAASGAQVILVASASGSISSKVAPVVTVPSGRGRYKKPARRADAAPNLARNILAAASGETRVSC